MKKILILGHGRHGKDSAAECISNAYGLTFQSSSMAACEKAVYPVLKLIYGYKSVDECFMDRHSCKEVWKQLISMYNTPDKARLCKEILSRVDVYVGMRCPLEYEASKRLFDHVIWVDGSKRKSDDSTMKIEYDPDTMLYLDNNGDEDDLPVRVAELNNCIEGWGLFI